MKVMQRRLDNILFSEIKYPLSRYFPVCKAFASPFPQRALQEWTPFSHLGRALHDSRLSGLKAETPPHHSMDCTHQNYPFSHGIWCRKQKQHYILLKDKTQSIQISHVLQWTLNIYGKKGSGRTPEYHCLSINFSFAAHTYRKITISVVPPDISTTPTSIRNNQELYRCHRAKQNKHLSPFFKCTLSHEVNEKEKYHP